MTAPQEAEADEEHCDDYLRDRTVGIVSGAVSTGYVFSVTQTVARRERKCSRSSRNSNKHSDLFSERPNYREKLM